MTRKEIILDSILANPTRTLPEVYGTDRAELGAMYGVFVKAKKDQVPFEKFLVREGAVTGKNEIRKDRRVEFYAKDLKKNIKTSVVFSYPIYTQMESKWQDLEQGLRERDKEAMKDVVNEKKQAFIGAFGDDEDVKKQADELFG